MGESKSSNYSWEEYLVDASSIPTNVSNPKKLDRDTFNWARSKVPSLFFGNDTKLSQKNSIAEVHKMRNYRRHKKDSNAKFLKFIKEDFRRTKKYGENSKTLTGRVMNAIGSAENPLGKKGMVLAALNTRLDDAEMPTFDSTFTGLLDNNDWSGFDDGEEYDMLGQDNENEIDAIANEEIPSVMSLYGNEEESPAAGSAFIDNASKDQTFVDVSNERMRGGKKRRTRKKKHKKKKRKTRRKRKTKKTKRRRPKRRRRTRKR